MEKKNLVLYDSAYGNTEKIAQAIGQAIYGEVKMLEQADSEELKRKDAIFIGSPTQGGSPTLATQEFLTKIPDGELKGIKVAGFDTRFAKEEHGLFLLGLMKLIGFAAPKIGKTLKKKGGKLLGVEGFIVAAKEGPLNVGEEERAKKWAKGLL